ncbi:TIGR02206 family membrane protein [Planomicrobium okeanokoites]|uniref:YwaF family protein n=1 Tax=Planomicrobium okeanokoites TaxID=244 RepID=UPI00248F6A8D|nr:TIGR02206 family membrane protein [Planomicrobium okeanokoites]
MDSWFGITSQHYFTPFSASHLTVLAIAALGIFLLIVFRKQLMSRPLPFQVLRWILFSLLLLSEVSYQYWTISNGIWNFAGHVPLHLCGVASITAMIGLLTMRRSWIQISFFIGIVPAFLALVTPDLPFDYHHFRFWKFFVHHTAIPWACLFLALAKPETITLRSVIKVFLLLVAYALAIGYLVNPLTDANYLYLMQLPNTVTPLSFFGDGIWYYLNLGITALLLFLFQNFLWNRYINKDNKRLL